MENECPYCNATLEGWGQWKTTTHHPECPSQYRPKTHALPLTNANGDIEPPLETIPAESE